MEQRQAEELLAGQNRILAMIASGAPLQEVLNDLAVLMEGQSTMRASFLLLDKNRLWVGAGPSLPEAYTQAINGAPVDPDFGPCATAAYCKQPILVMDIAQDPRWANFRELALSHGLRASWSTPILSTAGAVLGTFAGYYDSLQAPVEADQVRVQETLYLAKIAIERQQSQSALQASEEKFRQLAETIHEVFWVTDVDAQTVVYVSPAYESIWGRTCQSLYEDPATWFSAIHPDDRSLLFGGAVNPLKQPLRCQKFDEEYRIIRPDGEIRWIRDRGFPVFNQQGRVYRMTGIAQDITQQKRAELGLRRSETQLRQKTEALEAALAEVQQAQVQLFQSEKMSSLGQMVAGIAHEINNPVSFIYGNVNHAAEYSQELLNLVQLYRQHYPTPVAEIQDKAEAMELDFLAADLPKLLNSMQVGAERIKKIVASLRTFSHVDGEELRAADLHEGIDNTLTLLSNQLKEKSDRPAIEVEKDYGSLPLVPCFPGQINQVFMNILSNAVDALESWPHSQTSSPSSEPAWTPRIWIQTQRCDDGISVRIANNGPDISEGFRARLFDPFFTTKPVGKGTGMGLAISYQIVVERHQGTLSCESIPGQETAFVVKLPIKI